MVRWCVGHEAYLKPSSSDYYCPDLLLLNARRIHVPSATGFLDAIVHGVMKAGKVTPVIDRHYKLIEVPEVIRYLEAGHTQGKSSNNTNWIFPNFRQVPVRDIVRLRHCGG
jgi:hypothetical protein